ncbi:MAG: PH domain-containing protein [Minisyncoccia bacterium]|jgi:membrane protein YdbS with pleckstrin-like domain
MIPLNQEQRLGRKAYLLLASRKMTAGLVILLIAVVLMVLSAPISGFLAGVLIIGGAKGATAAVSGTVGGLIMGLIIVALLACIVGLVIAKLQYANYTFTFEEFDLKLKQGIVSTTIVSIPYRQMQDVDVERSLLHRLTGTSRVVIDSAGHEEKTEDNETDIVLEPIDKETADEIRLMLQRKIGVQVVEGEKEADTETDLANKGQIIN